jgi:hypothetical protein
MHEEDDERGRWGKMHLFSIERVMYRMCSI